MPAHRRKETYLGRLSVDLECMDPDNIPRVVPQVQMQTRQKGIVGWGGGGGGGLKGSGRGDARERQTGDCMTGKKTQKHSRYTRREERRQQDTETLLLHAVREA